MSLARRHRDRILAAQTITAANAPAGGVTLASAAAPLPAAGATHASPAERAAAEIGLRLTHDLRRLKEIRSIDAKIAAKKTMLPDYADWVAGILSADAGIGTGLAAEVTPVMMIWHIDVGAYASALDIAEFLLRHHVEMPARYQRDAATIVVEEIADAALKAQAIGTPFPLDILTRVDDLTSALDIHDQVRAKLMKAIGVEQLREAEEMPADDSFNALVAAVANLNEAQRLHDRVGVKDRIKRGLKLMAAITAAREQAVAAEAIEQGGPQAA